MFDFAVPPMSLSQVARRCGKLRANKPVSPSTVARWIAEGLKVNGRTVKLGAFKVGRTLVVTEGSLQKFLADLNGTESQQINEAPAARLPSGAAASKRLDQLGVGV